VYIDEVAYLHIDLIQKAFIKVLLTMRQGRLFAEFAEKDVKYMLYFQLYGII
jgi:hypothetical protein